MLTLTSSRSPSPPRLLRSSSSPVRCASSTGTPLRMSGATSCEYLACGRVYTELTALSVRASPASLSSPPRVPPGLSTTSLVMLVSGSGKLNACIVAESLSQATSPAPSATTSRTRETPRCASSRSSTQIATRTSACSRSVLHVEPGTSLVLTSALTVARSHPA